MPKLTSETGRRIHGSMMLFWIANFAIVWALPHTWRIPYLIVCSIYANFVGHWSGYSAERPHELEETA